VTEGEKCADLVRPLGLTATTSAQGAQSARKSDWGPLKGKEVVILPDNDEPGEKYAADVARLAYAAGARSVKVLRLPGLTQKGDDIEQWIEARKDLTPEQLKDAIERLADETSPEEPPDEGRQSDEVTEHGATVARERRPTRHPSQAESLIELGSQNAEFFCSTTDGKAYARVHEDGHYEVYAVRGPALKRRLTTLLYDERGTAPSSEAMKSAIDTLEAKAFSEGQQADVYLRVAKAEIEGKPVLYLDLADQDWRAVEIDDKGWRVVANPPVMFRRSKSMKPVPEPQHGGSLDPLWEFANVKDADDRRLLVATLCSYLRADGPYPILVLQGEQGTAKSTTTRVITRLIDPSRIMRSQPRNVEDLFIAATQSWVMTMDNLSGVPPWLSDALCRLSNGGGFATRTKYESEDETCFDAMRPIVLNGIDNIAERPDLMDRAVVLHLPIITGEQRLTEQGFWDRFAIESPKILGALLDAVAGGLRELGNVSPPSLPRMADFGRHGEAVGRSLGWVDGAFLAALDQNQDAANATLLGACPVTAAIKKFMDQQPAWTGTATELLDRLNRLVDEHTARSGDWPRDAKSLSNRLNRLAPSLRRDGLAVERRRVGKKRLITITNASPDNGRKSSSPSSSSSPEDRNLMPESDLERDDSENDDRHPSSPTAKDRHHGRPSPTVTDRHRSSSGNGQEIRRKPVPQDELACTRAEADDDDDDDDDLSPSESGDHADPFAVGSLGFLGKLSASGAAVAVAYEEGSL
jgi:hypothetical protein